MVVNKSTKWAADFISWINYFYVRLYYYAFLALISFILNWRLDRIKKIFIMELKNINGFAHIKGIFRQDLAINMLFKPLNCLFSKIKIIYHPFCPLLQYNSKLFLHYCLFFEKIVNYLWIGSCDALDQIKIVLFFMSHTSSQAFYKLAKGKHMALIPSISLRIWFQEYADILD
jgi:hypothetical protein